MRIRFRVSRVLSARLIAALSRLSTVMCAVGGLKVGNRRGTEYKFVSTEELTQLRTAGRLLIETHRYGNTYAIDRLTAAGQVPIVHLGHIADIRRLIQSAPWLVVLLWIPRQVCEQRSLQRGERHHQSPPSMGRNAC
ncbi:hypothetical protein ABZW49_15915 [Nonomuraea wenchangensis]